MAPFTAEVYQNEFLPDGGSDVHAIVTRHLRGRRRGRSTGSGDAGRDRHHRHLRLDGRATRSPPPSRPRRRPLDEMLDGVWFAVIAGNHEARLVYPTASEPGMVRMDAETRAAAKAAIGCFAPDGGTAMGTWLRLATRVFATVPGLAQKHAILLTDGINEHETPGPAHRDHRRRTGQFQCDCRGVGADWQVEEVRRIATPCSAAWTSSPRPRNGRRLRADHAAVDGPRCCRGMAAGVGPAGRRRSSSSGRSPPPSTTSPPDAPR